MTMVNFPLVRIFEPNIWQELGWHECDCASRMSRLYFHRGGIMTSLISALEQLRAERRKAQTQVQKLDQAISAIESLNGSVASRTTGARIISVEARRKMSLAQKARRARERGNNGTAARKPLSVAARKKIASAQRARWAKFRARQSKAA